MNDLKYEDFFYRPSAAMAIVAILGIAAYANVIGYPFVHDDIPLVAQNPLFQHWSWREVLFHKTNFSDASDLSRPYYRPLLDVMNYAMYSFFGPNPKMFHALNIVLHVFNGWLVFFIVRMIAGKLSFQKNTGHWVALLTAVLFVVHPVQTQAVACVSGISNLLCGFLCLASLACCISADGFEGSRRQKRMTTAAFVFVLALLCKEQALTLPVVIIGYELWRAHRLGYSYRVVLPTAMVFMSLIVSYVAWKQVIGVPTLAMDPTAGGWTRIAAIPHILLENLRVIFLPYDLHYFRSLDLFANHFVPAFVLGVIIVIVFYILRFFQNDNRQLMIAGLIWFVATQITTVQIVPLFWEYSSMSVAEHFLYLPSIGLFLALAAILRELWMRVSSQVQTALSACIVLMVAVLISLTIIQNDVWSSETRLFERAVRYESHLGRLQHVLAQAYFHQGRYAEAIAADRKTEGIMSRYESVAVGDTAKMYYRTIRMDAMMSIGVAYRMMNDIPSALEWVRRAVDLNPSNADHQSTLGVFYAESGQLDKAHEHLSKAVELAPDNPQYARNLKLLSDQQLLKKASTP